MDNLVSEGGKEERREGGRRVYCDTKLPSLLAASFLRCTWDSLMYRVSHFISTRTLTGSYTVPHCIYGHFFQLSHLPRLPMKLISEPSYSLT